MGQTRKDRSSTQVIVTVICAICVSVTSVVSARIAQQTTTRYEVKLIPSFDGVSVDDYLPLRKGNRWVYEGTAMTTTTDGPVVKGNVRLSMRVIGEKHAGTMDLYMMEGHPSDAVWALDHAQDDIVDVPPSRYAYVVVGNKVFRIADDEIDRAMEVLVEGDGFDESLLSADNLEFEFPLSEGLQFGRAQSLGRKDMMYRWVVSDITLCYAAGDEGLREVPHYQLVHKTLPDRISLWFTPYLGITSYSYQHNGTIAEVDLSLKEYEVHTD